MGTGHCKLFDVEFDLTCSRCGHSATVSSYIPMDANDLQDFIYKAVKMLREKYGITELPAWAEAAGLQAVRT